MRYNRLFDSFLQCEQQRSGFLQKCNVNAILPQEQLNHKVITENATRKIAVF